MQRLALLNGLALSILNRGQDPFSIVFMLLIAVNRAFSLPLAGFFPYFVVF